MFLLKAAILCSYLSTYSIALCLLTQCFILLFINCICILKIHFVDGTKLIHDPVKVLKDVQLFLQVADMVDYSKYLK